MNKIHFKKLIKIKCMVLFYIILILQIFGSRLKYILLTNVALNELIYTKVDYN